MHTDSMLLKVCLIPSTFCSGKAEQRTMKERIVITANTCGLFMMKQLQKKVKFLVLCVYWRGVAMICKLTEQGIKIIHTQF